MIKLPFKKLKVWDKGMNLTKKVFLMTKKFPKEEQYGLTSQVRRASVSIPSNIAEGSQRGTDKDFARYILIAKGSLAELETQLILSENFEYITSEKLNDILSDISELQKMLHTFHIKLTASC